MNPSVIEPLILDTNNFIESSDLSNDEIDKLIQLLTKRYSLAIIKKNYTNANGFNISEIETLHTNSQFEGDKFRILSDDSEIYSLEKYINPSIIAAKNGPVSLNPQTGNVTFDLTVGTMNYLNGSSEDLKLIYRSDDAAVEKPSFNRGNVAEGISNTFDHFTISPGWRLNLSYFGAKRIATYSSTYGRTESYRNIDITSINLSDGRSIELEKVSNGNTFYYKVVSENSKDVTIELCDTQSKVSEFYTYQIAVMPNERMEEGCFPNYPSLIVKYKNGTKEYFNYDGNLLGKIDPSGNGYIVNYSYHKLAGSSGNYGIYKLKQIVSSAGMPIDITSQRGAFATTTFSQGSKLIEVEKELDSYIFAVSKINIKDTEDESKSDVYEFVNEEVKTSFTWSGRYSTANLRQTLIREIRFPTGLIVKMDYYSEAIDIGLGGYLEKPYGRILTYTSGNGKKEYLEENLEKTGEMSEHIKNNVKTTYNHNDDYLPIRIEKKVDNKLVEATAISYDENHNKTSITKSLHNSLENVEKELIDTYLYSEKGNLLESQRKDGPKFKYEYEDVYNNCIKSEVYDGESLLYTSDYEYDNLGRLLSLTL